MSGPTVCRSVGFSRVTYNFARKIKALSGLIPCVYICKIWISEPDRSILNPVHQMRGLNRVGPISLRYTGPPRDLRPERAW